MIGFKQLALVVCDAHCPVAYRRALCELRAAVDAALDELDRPLDDPEPAVDPEPPEPPDFWQRHADDTGEPLLVLSREQRLDGEQYCIRYAVAEANASTWERANAERRVEPRGTG